MKQCPECGKYYYDSDSKCITCNCILNDLDEVESERITSSSRLTETSGKNIKQVISTKLTSKEENDVSKKHGVEKPNYSGSFISLIVTGLLLLWACKAPDYQIFLRFFLWLAVGLTGIFTWMSFSGNFFQAELYHAAKKGEESYQKVKERQDKEKKELEQRQKRKTEEDNKKRYNNYVYTCPMCGSDRVINISMTKKGLGIATVGLASKTIGKNYQCAACKYMW